MIQLKGGNTTEDPRLDRIYPGVRAHLPSLRYLIGDLLRTPRMQSYTWRCEPRLDQGDEGACVGFGWEHEKAARPVIVASASTEGARATYHEAQTVDEWPGEDYDGTSVLAGAKVVKAHGFMQEYRWALTLEDLMLTIGNYGPVVLGVNWYSGMFNPDDKGYIHVSGWLAGGHCILANGVNLKGRYFRLHNSWGPTWGVNGECFISFEDVERLLAEQGEACVPIRRRSVPA